jgi:ATP-binding cassette, subfamily C (CFTR/MRP), member 1
MRYKDDLPLAVRDVSFSVPAGTRVGICGRTGSGKSTLLSLLFRMIDYESGTITISGRDITTLPRQKLRQELCAISQDPLLVDLSLRDNCAPFEGVDDAEIWAALEQTQCKSVVENLKGGLDHQVAANGGSFSRGTRQLLALTRALLQKPRLLVLDEASSSLDVQTDATTQRVLREAFGRETTLLVVAHRISTIRDLDLILVMDNGRLVEQGPPDELLKREGSIFRRLAGEE